MASKKRWTLMPRKWFGLLAHAAQQRDRERKSQLGNSVTPVRSATPHRSAKRSQTKVTPIDDSNSIDAVPAITQFQLPAFSARRKKTSTVVPVATLFSQTSNSESRCPKPSVQKKGRPIEPLPIYLTRSITQTVVPEALDVFVLSSVPLQKRCSRLDNSFGKPSDLTNACSTEYTRTSSNRFSRHSLSLTRTHSSSSMENNDSSSSGVFSEQRGECDERHHLASKDMSSTLEILSVESLSESRTSLDRLQSPPPIVPYRLSIPSLEPTNKQCFQTLHQSATIHFHRASSVERTVKESLNSRSAVTKTRQSSAAIVKKIEKRLPVHRSPPNTCEKPHFVRVTNDTYRLSSNKENHLYRRQRPHSIVQHSIHDDPLPSANDEDRYAHVPRTSSTERVNNNLQNDLRAIVDDCLRPIIDSVDQPATFPAHDEYSNSLLENITDKLLSSMDSSLYAQYQRCH